MRQRAVRAGTWTDGLQDPGPLIAHVAALREGGMSARSIAAAAGVSLATVSALAWPDRHGSARTRGVQRHTHDAILAVRGPHQAPPNGLVPIIGTVRRLQALARMGWTVRAIAATANMPHQSIAGLDGARRIRKATADAITRVYNELSMRPGPSDITRRRAAAAGYAPPLAWDDDTVDDPNAEPEGAGYTPGPVIDRIRELEHMGLDRPGIAERLGVTRDAIDTAITRAARAARDAA
ncbi:MAG TPA: hypothetical protein VMV41_17240 [Cellulomonadaceae bacterium]|nr:hypothetical protein [Cellulomonadaceae bacterium]